VNSDQPAAFVQDAEPFLSASGVSRFDKVEAAVVEAISGVDMLTRLRTRMFFRQSGFSAWERVQVQTKGVTCAT